MAIINLYFAICLIAYVIDVVAVMAIIFIVPLRKWCWRKYCELCKEFTNIWLDFWPDLDEDKSDENY